MYFWEKYGTINAAIRAAGSVSRRLFREKRMKRVKIKAYAKVNLTLEILGTKDGYHLLDSLVASVDLFDLVVLKKRKDKLSSVTMKGLGSESIPPERNNALKAAEAFSERFGVNGADITVFRNIPVGAGLGSSSADIAGVLNGMAKLYEIADTEGVAQIADTLGSDARYMLTGGFARMQGRGEQVTPLPIDTKLHLLLLCPRLGVSAGECYRVYDESPQMRAKNAVSATENCIEALQGNLQEQAGRYLMNDLFEPAMALNPDVKTAYEEARSFSPLGAVMTGSGSCVLAAFETRELCEWAKSRYKGKFRTYVTQTVIPNKQEISDEWQNPFALSKTEKAALDE